MTTHPDAVYAGDRFPAEVVSYAVYRYFRFPMSLRMVEQMLALRGITVSHETIRRWGLMFITCGALPTRTASCSTCSSGTGAVIPSPAEYDSCRDSH